MLLGATTASATPAAPSRVSESRTEFDFTFQDLPACTTVQYKIIAIDGAGNATTTPDQAFFTGNCSQVHKALPPACDAYDPSLALHIRTASQAAQVRQRLIQAVWSGRRLPSRLPDSVIENIPPASVLGVPSDHSMRDFGNLGRIDELHVRLDKGFAARMYLLSPRADDSRRLVIVHQGHESGPAVWVSQGLWMLEAELLKQGYSVLLVSMPIQVPNAWPAGLSSHRQMQAMESPSHNPLATFMEPIAIAVNHAVARHKFRDISMVGVSGGGWSVTLYSAIDPRIRLSFSVAGTLPLGLRALPCGDGSDLGDYEQGTAGMPATLFSEVASYLDLYVLGAIGPGRQRVQITNEFDPCCFAGVRPRIYADTVDAAVKTISPGSLFSAIIDSSHRQHQVSPWATADIILPALNANQPLAGALTRPIR